MQLPSTTSGPAPVFDKQVVGALKTAIEMIFQDTLESKPEIDTWSVSTGPLELSPYITCTIEMKQDDERSSVFITALSRETIYQILEKFGVQEKNDEKIIQDTTEEIANMIYGMFKTALNKTGYKFLMDIPLSHGAEGLTEFDESEKMFVPFSIDGHRCRVVIAHCR